MPILNFDNLKKQAKQLVRWHREGYHPVAQHIRAVLPRYRELDDGAILSGPFTLADAHELIARELGFDSWEALRTGDGETQTSAEQVSGHEPHLLGAFPQLFVGDIEVSCRFFVETLGFTLRFKPRWTPENRPYVDTSKPANGAEPEQEYLYLARGHSGKHFFRVSARRRLY